MKNLFLALSLVASTFSLNAMAYEPREKMDAFDISCHIQGRGVSENMDIHGWITRGKNTGRISSGVYDGPGIFDKNYNPEGSKALLAVLVKLLGTPSYAFTSSTSQTAEGIIKKDDLKFPENFSYQRTETSWNNDSERPDAIFQYEVLNLHGEDAYLRFTIKFPSSGKIAYFGGPCVAN